MKNENKIICIGEALIDMICTDKGKPLSAGENFLKKAGGAPTNVAAAIGALGGRVMLLATVGNDPFGEHLFDVMQSFSVDTSQMRRNNDHFTTLAFVSLMENGERDFYFNRGADAVLDKLFVYNLPLDNIGIVHFGSATAFLDGPLSEAYDALLQKALAAGKFISFDPNYRQLLFGQNQQHFIRKCWGYLQACNFFKVSDEEALLLTSRSELSDAISVLQQKTNAVFAVTIGKDGTLLRVGSQVVQVPSIPAQVTDTTGAGDAFTGAVLFQLQQGFSSIQQMQMSDWQQVVRNGNKAGAKTCEYMGAMEAFRYLSTSIFND